MHVQAFGALIAGLSLLGSQQAAQAIDLFDDRKARDNGFGERNKTAMPARMSLSSERADLLHL